MSIEVMDVANSQLLQNDSPPLESFRLSVLVPVFNERYLIEPSLRGVLALDDDLISELEVIVVDDCSTDGTWDVLQSLAGTDERITLVRHERNQGKGAAIRTAIAHATGDISIIHDADLEYYPSDIPSLLIPFAKEGADAVFGSRYLSAPYRRALMHRHTFVNKLLTGLSNWLTDLHLTDMETCYKAINTTLLKSIPLRSDDYRFEVEVVFKLAKRRARIFEVPIRYLPRTREEGKKIRARDGLLALGAMLRYTLIDDIYEADSYGSNILVELERTRRFNLWMGDALRPYIGGRVLEIGAGIGNITSQYIPRELYVASDISPHYLYYLRSYAHGKPYLRVMYLDANAPDNFDDLAGQFDTVLLVNVLEHLPDEHLTLQTLRRVLAPGGRIVVLVPQHPKLYNTLDEVLEHRERYTSEHLRQSLQTADFRVENLFDFNRFSVMGWWFNGRIMHRKTFSRTQLKILDLMVPILRRIDRFWPWAGLSVIGVGVRDEE